MSDFIELPLNGKDGMGKAVKISPEDWIWAQEYRWVFNQTKHNKGYVVTWKKGKRHYLHRMICTGKVVDHINRDTLDNRRENLRACTYVSNAHNAKASDGKTSAYKGVYKQKRKTAGMDRWRADIMCNGVRKRIGTFHTEIEAARAYDVEARIFFGEFAFLNFPEAEIMSSPA